MRELAWPRAGAQAQEGLAVDAAASSGGGGGQGRVRGRGADEARGPASPRRRNMRLVSSSDEARVRGGAKEQSAAPARATHRRTPPSSMTVIALT